MKLIHHGTTRQGLGVIKPFKRYTPGGADFADTIPARIYASYEPAYAVAHNFPWSSDDGVDIVVDDGVVTVVVPANKAEVLEQTVCIYMLPDDTFTFTTEEEMGLTYHSAEEVTPTDYQCFDSVTEAMVEMGGKIKLI